MSSVRTRIRTPHIAYESDGFPPGTIRAGKASLPATWNDILWAAITVGRPNRQYVFRHGRPSVYEAIFRWSLVRMALEQQGATGFRLHRTEAAKTLDPTEKGAVNYFLGMTFCKLFAAKLLHTPWLIHLDVFRPMLNAVLRGRSRPDLVGKQHRANRWHAFECKGRITSPDAPTKTKAKSQARRVVSVEGVRCSLHVGAITYFRNDLLEFFWRDPPPEDGRAIRIPFDESAWRYYYSPAVELFEAQGAWDSLQTGADFFLPVEETDLGIGIHPAVAKLLFNRQWAAAQRAAEEASEEIEAAGYQPDGIKVKAGPSWSKPFEIE